MASVRGHLGCIKVESTLGKGSVFRLLFPANEEPIAASAATESDHTELSGAVLVVDDEEGVRRITRRNLERLGFQVVEAEDGEAGLECFRKGPDDFRCVLVDLMMPRLRGDEVLSAVRSLRPDMPVILASGYSETEVRDRYEVASASAILQKPFRREQLEQVLRAVLHSEGHA